MLDLFTLKPEAFGLDISDLSLRIVKIEKKGSFLDLAYFGENKIKPGIIVQGEIKKEDGLAEVIRKSLDIIQKEKLKTRYVVASLPEEKAFLEVIQLPKMEKQELKKAVFFEAENYVPFPLDDVYLDCQPVRPILNHLDHLDVLIAALPKKTVDPYVSALKKAGLQPLALEIESLAIARALVKKQISPVPVFLIDLGATRTSFIIFSGASLRLTSSIPVSSQKITEAVSRTLQVGAKEAEQLKLQYGIQQRNNKKGKQVFEAIIPCLTDLSEQIQKYINYYQTHKSHEHLPPNGRRISKVLLCGGGANLKGLEKFLCDNLKIPVTTGNPLINILSGSRKAGSGLSRKKSLAYTTALGLALRGVNS